jgi:hypothetical protein
VRLLRDSGRVLNRAPQFVGRPEGELQWQADICRRCSSRVASQEFLPARFCRRSWADLLLMRQSAMLLPSCAQPKNYNPMENVSCPPTIRPSSCGSGWWFTLVNIFTPQNGSNKSHDLIIQYLSPHGIYAMVPCLHVQDNSCLTLGGLCLNTFSLAFHFSPTNLKHFKTFRSTKMGAPKCNRSCVNKNSLSDAHDHGMSCLIMELLLELI